MDLIELMNTSSAEMKVGNVKALLLGSRGMRFIRKRKQIPLLNEQFIQLCYYKRVTREVLRLQP
jgi:hypothetical protein